MITGTFDDNRINTATILSSLTTPCRFNNIRYVDSTNACGWAGIDIGGWINSAYADLPTNGGTIWLSTATTPINFSTPIVFATSAKFVSLQCLTGTSTNCQLNYVPTTATTALTYDVVPIGGDNEAPGLGMSGIQLTNACCTQGGTGSSATGIKFGGTNIGGHALQFNNISVAGFGTGLNVVTANSWGMHFLNWTFASNTTGFAPTAATENLAFYQARFAGNNTAANISVGGDYYFYNPSIDQSVTAGFVISNGAVVNFVAPHFESSGTSTLTMNMVNASNGTGNTTVSIQGGEAADDSSGGAPSTYWFQFACGFHISGLDIRSSGRTATTIVNALSPARGYMSIANSTPGALTTMLAGANAGKVMNFSFPSNSGNAATNLQLNDAPLVPPSDNSGALGQPGQRFANSWVVAGSLNTLSILGSLNNLLISATTPTIAAGGCGGSGASIIPATASTASFKINVGAAPGASCTITMPSATTGWNCHAEDITTQSSSVFVQKQTGAESQTSVTITNLNTSAAATAFVANDILKVSCFAD